MKKFEQFKLCNLEDVGVYDKNSSYRFTGFAFYDAKLGITSFGVDRWPSWWTCDGYHVPEHVFIDIATAVDSDTAEIAVLDFAERTAKAESIYEQEMAWLRLKLMLKGYIKPLASNNKTEKESSAI